MFSLRTLSQHKILVIQKVFSPIYVIKRKERRSLLNILSSWVLVLYGIPESTKRTFIVVDWTLCFLSALIYAAGKVSRCFKNFFLFFFTTTTFFMSFQHIDQILPFHSSFCKHIFGTVYKYYHMKFFMFIEWNITKKRNNRVFIPSIH